jgi:S1-C subfamily serine protease
MTINNDGQYIPAASDGTDPGQVAPAQVGPVQMGPVQMGPTAMGPDGMDPTPRKPRSPWIAVAIATAAVVCIGGLGTAVLAELSTATHGSSSTNSSQGSLGTFGRGGGPSGQGGGQFQGGGQAIGQQATAGESPATPATQAQTTGLVVVDTILDYDRSEEAAGTGMIISSSGYVLTNNHVVEGATSIRVTIASTDKTYTAEVVGSDTTADVAVLKLVGASGLQTVSFAPSHQVSVGDSIYSVGNAEGTGHLVTAVGTVGAVDQSLTIGSDDSDASEHLTGMIELQSDVVSGDSGGALFDKNGDVIGMVTAASSGTTPITGDAINIAQVLKVVDEIQSDTTSTAIVYGTPAFIGVDISTETSTLGVPVAGTFPGLPAANAGIAEGDIITEVNGVSVHTAAGLSSTVRSYRVGTSVRITWLDAKGQVHSATTTLVAGPAS